MDPDYVASSLQLALMLELSITPKPGLVDRRGRRRGYEQFLSTISILYPYFKQAAEGREKTGRIIREACRQMLKAQSMGNTHLGSILLLTPLAKTAGETRSVNKVKHLLRKTLASLDHEDSLEILNAVREVRPGGLGRVGLLDVNDERTYEKIVKERISVIELFKPYSSYDLIAHEYATSYSYSIKHGYEHLKKLIRRGYGINDAGVLTFLNILSNIQDSFITRKYGIKTSRLISKMAHQTLKSIIVKEGGRMPRRYIEDFCNYVEKQGVKPAATADILAVALAFLTLEGWRP